MALVKSTENRKASQKCCYTWTKLILSASIPLILGIFTVIYTLQQDKLARFDREQDISQQEKIRKQTVYDAYITEISKTIRDRDFNISNVNQLNHIRSQTLNTLDQLDHEQKRKLIVFLYENGLIRANSPQAVNLRGADLTGVKFRRSAAFQCELNDLYLAEVSADNILFDGCQLQRCVFNRASLTGAQFLNSYTAYSSYEGAYMVQSVFNGSNTWSSSFASADLRYATFGIISLIQMNFTNTDLLDSDLTKTSLNSPSNIYMNTRFPNGSFSAINTTQLVVNGGAEINCPKRSSTPWIGWISGSKTQVVDKRYYNGSIEFVEGNCFFQLVATTEMVQAVALQQYSLFIDSGEAWYNLSAYLMCRSANPDDQAYVRVHFVTEKFTYVSSQSAWIRSIKGKTSFYQIPQRNKIPKMTRFIHVFIGANMASSIPIGNQTNECYIDRVRFYIFKELNVPSTPPIVTTESPKP